MRNPSRRAFLAGVGATGVGGLADCLGFELESGSREPPLVANRPDAVYRPTHTEGMAMAGMVSDGGYSCALTYSYPHRFWTVTGDDTTQVEVGGNDALHLMPIVWHSESGVVPSDVNPSVDVTRDGESVVDGLNPWPMLAQRMGFHFGDNVELPEQGEYTVTVSVGAGGDRRTGSLTETAAAEFEFTLDYQRSELRDLPFEDIAEARQGTLGAVEPMRMEMVPTTQAPPVDDLPGTAHGTTGSGDAVFAVRSLDDATPFGGDADQAYLAVSARTPYNRYPLPLMSLSGTLSRDGETAFDGYLNEWLDPDLGIHYGAVVDGVGSGDELTIAVDSPPQVSRHEGYETAFRNMPEATLTL
ncbi:MULTISPECIES: DUF7350 domain-containing protein [Halolamina]|uniref:DUF7350 domain-containing protein n=1 Tax=Halolamina pelagica TaxID=699431 RepID=A0A1I5QV37_9EURY|nr:MULTISPECIES: hypothetical protein [Halolamina]NHX35558.1 hypothetical protein [Halolamina sp. R1-12]SFP50158.1 hypothetical protein SAMN05216277_104103 [Halolamina pelagica]